MDSSLDIDDKLKDLTDIYVSMCKDKRQDSYVSDQGKDICKHVCKRMMYQRNFTLQQGVKSIPLQNREESEEKPKSQFLEHLEGA